MERQTVRRRFGGGVEASDAGGRAFWLLALTTGTFDYKGTIITIDADYIGVVVRETRRAMKRWRDMAELGSDPYTPPLLLEHQRAGKRHGDVIDLKSVEVPATEEAEALTQLWIKVRPTWDTAWEIDSDAFQYVSVRIIPGYKDQEGEVYELFLEELSITVNPFFKHLGKIKESITYEMSDGIIKEMALIFSDYEDEGEMSEQVMAKLAQIEQDNKTLREEIEGLKKAKEKPEVKASDEQTPAPVVAPAGVTAEQLKAHTEALHANTRALIASAGGGTTEIGAPGAPPAAAPTTLMGAIKGIMASDGVDEAKAAEISMIRYPNLF
jgi:hypothetical protein